MVIIMAVGGFKWKWKKYIFDEIEYIEVYLFIIFDENIQSLCANLGSILSN